LPCRIVFEAKQPSLLLLFFAKRVYARYRFIASHSNTPCPCKEYYYTRLPSDIPQSSGKP
jgi:hypothetical protein